MRESLATSTPKRRSTRLRKTLATIQTATPIESIKKGRKRKPSLTSSDLSMVENSENSFLDLEQQTSKKQKTLELSDFIETDLSKDISESILEKATHHSCSLLNEDEEEVSFKSPPIRTYQSKQRRKSELHEFCKENEEKSPVCEKKKGKKVLKKKIGTWDFALKKNKKLEEFVTAFNKELEEIEAVPLSVVRDT